MVTGGVVLDPASVIKEIDGLESRGVKVAGKLMLSDRAHVVFPWHIAEDKLAPKPANLTFEQAAAVPTAAFSVSASAVASVPLIQADEAPKPSMRCWVLV